MGSMRRDYAVCRLLEPYHRFAEAGGWPRPQRGPDRSRVRSGPTLQHGGQPRGPNGRRRRLRLRAARSFAQWQSEVPLGPACCSSWATAPSSWRGRGYLNGWSPTRGGAPARLGIYHDCGLLVAECHRRRPPQWPRPRGAGRVRCSRCSPSRHAGITPPPPSSEPSRRERRPGQDRAPGETSFVMMKAAADGYRRQAPVRARRRASTPSSTLGRSATSGIERASGPRTSQDKPRPDWPPAACPGRGTPSATLQGPPVIVGELAPGDFVRPAKSVDEPAQQVSAARP